MSDAYYEKVLPNTPEYSYVLVEKGNRKYIAVLEAKTNLLYFHGDEIGVFITDEQKVTAVDVFIRRLDNGPVL